MSDHLTYDDLVAITPSDTALLGGNAGLAGLLVTGTGTLKVTTRNGTTITLAAVAIGQTIRVPVVQVWATGTSATVAGLRGID